MQDHTPPAPDPIPFPKFIQAIAACNRQYSLLNTKFPHLSAFLVVSLPSGQTCVDNIYPTMFTEFPEFLLDAPAKTNGLTIAREILRLTKEKDGMPLAQRTQVNDQVSMLTEQLLTISHSLFVDGECRFELRFHQLDYELICLLQFDDLVDRILTPQTRASIRIVLGAVNHFCLS